jgi:hypothetical protein
MLEDTLENHLVRGLILHFPLVFTAFTVALGVELPFGKVFDFFVEMHHGVFENGHFSVGDTVFESIIFCLSLYLSFL